MTNEELCVLAQGGEETAKHRLVENNLGFIKKLANKYSEDFENFGIEFEEIVQEGCIGILEAVNRFDINKGTKFLTYATAYIEKYILLLPEKYGYEVYEVDEETEEKTYFSFMSFDGENENGESDADYIESILLARQPYIYSSNTENIFFEKLKSALIRESVANLNDREREYISYRFGIENGMHHSRKETAEFFNLKEPRAKQIEKSAIKNIRKHFEPQWDYICSRKSDCSEEKEYIVFEKFTDITAASKLYYFAHKHGLSEALKVFSGRTLKVSVPIKNELYGIKIDGLILSTRTVNILKKNKITTLGKLIAKIQNGQLRRIKNIGIKTVSEIQICVLNFCYGELDYLQKIYFFKLLLCDNCR